MTKLECSVENCVHNADQCCCRGSILVDGHGARDAEGTCCASFVYPFGETEPATAKIPSAPPIKTDKTIHADI